MSSRDLADPIPLLEEEARRLCATASDIARHYPVRFDDVLRELVLGRSPDQIKSELRLRAAGLR